MDQPFYFEKKKLIDVAATLETIRTNLSKQHLAPY